MMPVSAPPFRLPVIHITHGRVPLAHEVHGRHNHCPDSLACLLDTHERPIYHISIIIRAAILGSRERRLALDDIYLALKDKYPYFRTSAGERAMAVRTRAQYTVLETHELLKQDVEFELSIHDMFRRQRAYPSGHWLWTVNLDIKDPSTPLHMSTPQTGTTRQETQEDVMFRRQPRYCSLSGAGSSLSPSSPETSSASIYTIPVNDRPVNHGRFTVIGRDQIFSDSPGADETSSSSWKPSHRDVQLLLEDGMHPRHVGCPNSLRCLEDGSGEPAYTVPVMIRCAILSAKARKLSTHQICETLKTKYAYFRSRHAERKLNVRPGYVRCATR